MSDLAPRFMELFHALPRAYGTYKVVGSGRAGEKQTGKAVTIREPLTLELWEGHLAGRQGLGVIPILDSGCCRWGAIDIDVYEGLDLPLLSKKLEGTPLVLCRSKSGGAHCYVFFSEEVDAALVQRKLRELAAYLGYGRAEIFPKQTTLITEREDVGGWINAPYFGGEMSTRYALRDGAALSPEVFLEYAAERALTSTELEAYLVPSQAPTSRGVEALPDGPPCLQHLLTMGFPEGTRNKGLLAVGVYLKQAHPDDWERKLDEYNVKYLDPPLSSKEIQDTVVKSLRRREYNYSCKDAPLVSFCNRSLCLKRKFGVKGQSDSGKDDEMPQLGALTKINTDPPTYFMDVNGERMGPLETDDLLQQHRFQRKCAEKINYVIPVLRPNKWRDLLQSLFLHVTVVEVPADASSRGRLWHLLDKFCFQRAPGQTREDLLRGQSWVDDEGVSWFMMASFMYYHTRAKISDFKKHQVAATLREQGLSHKQLNIRGKNINVWGIRDPAPLRGAPEPPSKLTKNEAY
jgi:hypothetical protein